MTDKELDEELEKLKNSSETYRHVIEDQIKTAKEANLTDKAAKEMALKFTKSIEEANKMYKRTTGQIEGSLKVLAESYKKQEVTIEDVEEQLQRLRREVDRTADQSAKAALIKQKADLEDIVLRKKVGDNLKESLSAQVVGAGAAMASGLKEAAKTAMASGDGIQVAGGLMKTGIDIANNSVQMGASSMKDIGGQMAQMGGKAKAVGIGLSFLGSVVGGVANGMSELAKTGIDMMIKGVTQSITTFRTMSQSGALFADGIEGMRTAASGAGMSLEDFSKVATTNKAAFSNLGLGVTAGMQKMSKAMNEGGVTMRKELFALGYSMEDQGNMMAEVMSTMAGPAGRLKASDAQVAEATKKYAQNLSLLSALTGEDIKAKEEAIKKENDTLAFQQILDGMGEKERLEMQESMKGMNEIQRKALRERMIYGTVISADVNIAESQSASFKKQNEHTYNLAKNHQLTLEKTLEAQAEYAPAIKKETMALKESAKAGLQAGGPLADANKGLLQTTQYQAKISKEGLDQVRKDIKDREKQADKDPMVDVQEKQRAFGIKMEELTTKHMKNFGEALGKTMEVAEKAMGEFSEFVSGAAKNPGWAATILGAVTTLSGAMPAIGMLLTYILNKKGGGGDGGIDMPDGPDGKGKPKGPKPTSRVGKVFNAAKNIGARAVGFLPGMSTAATAAAPAATAATSTAVGATGATSLLGKGASLALKGLRFAGPAGAIANAAYGGFQGYQNAGANFDLKEGEKATAGQKASSTLGGILSQSTFGLLDEKKASQGIHSVGSSIGNFYSNMYGKVAGGVGSVVSGGANLIGGGISALAGKAGLGSGYSPMGGPDPKVFLDAQKANNDKLVGTMKEFGEAIKSSNKSSTDMTDLLKTQLAKQDEFISILKEHLGVSQSLLTTAQG
jgi:hypothetical protein